MAADDGWRDDAVRSGANQFLFSLFFDGTRDDVQVWIEAARDENDIDVVRIVWQTGG